jgi:hypothetical protein
MGRKYSKSFKRQAVDLIIQNPQDVGLPRPTRFDLDRLGTFLWQPPFFGCWQGYTSPKIGSLTEVLIREYAFIRIKRDFRLKAKRNGPSVGGAEAVLSGCCAKATWHLRI